MSYKPKEKQENSGLKICSESIETLQRYKRRGIPLMPHQEEFLDAHYAKFRSQMVD